MVFSQIILQWYKKNKRELPWRSTRDPYRIWLSEIILQQTRVAQGLPYYLNFIEEYPTVFDLANANEEQILKSWQGLGYYSRARNLHAAAKMVVKEYNGEFPNTYKGLLKLKGVGDYTASAIASICFNLPEPVVDGNVYRVLSRYFGIGTPINSSKGVSYFKGLAYEVMDIAEIRDYNQGIMEFGAIQCTPKSPDCGSCPLKGSCVAVEKNKIGDWPVKLKKVKVRNRFFNYLVVMSPDGKTILKQRTGKGIWQNLWEFPLVESSSTADFEEIKVRYSEVLQIDCTPETSLYNTDEIVHKLSHQSLYTKFWILRITDEPKDGIPFEALENYPVPVLIADFINAFKF